MDILLAIDQLPGAALVLDGEGRIIAANDECAGLLEEHVDALIGRRIDAVVWEAGDQFAPEGVGDHGWRRAMTLWAKHRSPFEAEVATRKASGTWGVGVVVMLRELAALRSQAQVEDKGAVLLRQAIRLARLGIFEHDQRNGKVYWSAEHRLILGLGPDEDVTFERYVDRIHPEDRARVLEAIARAHDPNGDGRFEIEHRVLFDDESVHWMEARSQTTFEGTDEARRPIHTLGATADVTERRRAEQERERLSVVLDATPDIVAIATGQGEIMSLNRAGREFFGLTPGMPVQGLTLVDQHAPTSRARWQEDVWPKVLRDGMWCGEMTLVQVSGSLMPCSQLVVAHRGIHGELLFISTIARDLSDSKYLEAQLRQSQKMEAVGRLAGGVAHDFNNILSVIMSIATLCYDDLPRESPMRGELSELLRAAERAADLTRKMLAFSRKQVLRPEIVDVDVVLARMASMLRRLIGEDIELVIDARPGLAWIKVDPNHLEQIFMNLAVNARDSMTRGGRLVFAVDVIDLADGDPRLAAGRSAGAFVRIVVSDTGLGMDADVASRAFEPFFTTKSPGQGSGLGLSTVLGIVEQSEGHIGLDTAPGRGAAFEILFPRTTDPPTSGALASEPVVPSAPPLAATILLVEDEEPLRYVIAAILAREGYRVLDFSVPTEALEAAKTYDGEITLLLTDVVMPHMHGKQLADAVLLVRPAIKVIFMSGYTETAIVHCGVLDEHVDFLPKPVLPAPLLRLVGEVLRRPVPPHP